MQAEASKQATKQSKAKHLSKPIPDGGHLLIAELAKNAKSFALIIAFSYNNSRAGLCAVFVQKLRFSSAQKGILFFAFN